MIASFRAASRPPPPHGVLDVHCLDVKTIERPPNIRMIVETGNRFTLQCPQARCHRPYSAYSNGTPYVHTVETRIPWLKMSSHFPCLLLCMDNRNSIVHSSAQSPCPRIPFVIWD